MIEAKLRLAEALGGALTRAALPSLGDGVTVSALTRLTAGAANETWRFEATGASGKQTCILRRAPFVAEAAPEDNQNLGEGRGKPGCRRRLAKPEFPRQKSSRC